MEIALLIINILLCYMNYKQESYKTSLLSAFTVGMILDMIIRKYLQLY